MPCSILRALVHDKTDKILVTKTMLLNMNMDSLREVTLHDCIINTSPTDSILNATATTFNSSKRIFAFRLRPVWQSKYIMTPKFDIGHYDIRLHEIVALLALFCERNLGEKLGCVRTSR